jgi:hypothetical protein
VSARAARWIDRLHLLALVVAAFLRGFVVHQRPLMSAIYSDMQGYHQNAHTILNGHLSEGSFFQPIGLSAVVAFLIKVGLGEPFIASVHIVLGTVTAHLCGRIGERLGGRWVGLAAVWIGSVHVALIYMGSLMMAETFFAFLLACAAFFTMRFGLRFVSAFGACVCLGASYWFKGFTLPVMALMIAWTIWFAFRNRKLRRTRNRLIAYAVTLALMLGSLPFQHRYVTLKTARVAVWGPTASGLNLVEGKCPWKQNEDSNGAGWWSPLYVQQGKRNYRKWDKPFTDAAYFQKQGLQCIKDNPVVMLYSFRHIAELFILNELWPASSEGQFRKINAPYEIGFIIFAFPGLLGSVYALIRIRKRERFRRAAVGVVAPLLGLCLTVYIFKSEVRFRVPFDPLVIALAAFGWTPWFQLLGRLWRRVRGERAQVQQQARVLPVATVDQPAVSPIIGRVLGGVALCVGAVWAVGLLKHMQKKTPGIEHQLPKRWDKTGVRNLAHALEGVRIRSSSVRLDNGKFHPISMLEGAELPTNFEFGPKDEQRSLAIEFREPHRVERVRIAGDRTRADGTCVAKDSTRTSFVLPDDGEVSIACASAEQITLQFGTPTKIRRLEVYGE